MGRPPHRLPILESQKQSATATYDGRTGYQPVIALWAEQDYEGTARPKS
jgi:hypothetical protein